MEYLTLFYVFFKIGLFTFGGGYAMIPMIEDEVVGRGWLTAGELLNFIGVAESTPGPIAVNIATFIGSSRAGFLGALCATVGVVLPSFLIILLIAAVFRNFLKNRVVKGALVGIRGVIVGLILATGLWMALQVVLFTGADGAFAFARRRERFHQKSIKTSVDAHSHDRHFRRLRNDSLFDIEKPRRYGGDCQ